MSKFEAKMRKCKRSTHVKYAREKSLVKLKQIRKYFHALLSFKKLDVDGQLASLNRQTICLGM